MKAIVEYVRLLSSRGRVITAEQAAAIAGVELEQDIQAQHQALVAEPEFHDVVLCCEQDQHFLYSNQVMADSYAAQCVAIECGEPLRAMTTEVSRFSGLGELLPATTFSHPPYKLTSEQLEQQRLLLCEQPNIGYVEGNDGDGYLYDSNHISASYAQVLADYDEFEHCC
ncbi:hypothetical protein [Ferrimonas lipolytica]|uniref:Uncharacterized protein n=1 Tax=Ferrimonas lipolytica TaxID=2724191 RepID=A0A6H1UED9_9GAMM|nr:hypothetical protein [Ferrimonas lipolytica]QIZ76960.1 hypothetical protein HER31_08765 [Ferrimonas lipolytica]